MVVLVPTVAQELGARVYEAIENENSTMWGFMTIRSRASLATEVVEEEECAILPFRSVICRYDINGVFGEIHR